MTSIRDLVGGYFSNVLQSQNRGEGTSRLALERSSERYEQDQLVSLGQQSHTRKSSSLLRSRPLFEMNREKRGSFSSMESNTSSFEQVMDESESSSSSNCYFSVVEPGKQYRSVQIDHAQQQAGDVDYSNDHIARIQRDRLLSNQDREQHHNGRRFACGDRRRNNRPKRDQLLEIFMGAAALNL
jgi:hypothetical protein